MGIFKYLEAAAFGYQHKSGSNVKEHHHCMQLFVVAALSAFAELALLRRGNYRWLARTMIGVERNRVINALSVL